MGEIITMVGSMAAHTFVGQFAFVIVDKTCRIDVEGNITPALWTIVRNISSAVHERQILPRQMNRIFVIMGAKLA